jgi:hypothetical protein
MIDSLGHEVGGMLPIRKSPPNDIHTAPSPVMKRLPPQDTAQKWTILRFILSTYQNLTYALA